MFNFRSLLVRFNAISRNVNYLFVSLSQENSNVYSISFSVSKSDNVVSCGYINKEIFSEGLFSRNSKEWHSNSPLRGDPTIFLFIKFFIESEITLFPDELVNPYNFANW